MSDWIARKLAERLGQQPRPGYQQRPVNQPPVPQVPAYSYPGQIQPPAQQPQQQEVDRSVDPNDPMGTAMRAAQAAGDQGHTKTCPECRKDALYTIDRNESGYPLRTSVQMCAECGWPRTQSGSLHGAASLMKPTGAAKPARQLRNHVVEVDWSGAKVAYEPQVGGNHYV